MEAYLLTAFAFCVFSGIGGYFIGWGKGHDRGVIEGMGPVVVSKGKKPVPLKEVLAGQGVEKEKFERKARPSWQKAKSVLERDYPGEREDQIMQAHKDVRI